MLSKTALKSSTTCLLRLFRRKLAKSFAAASNPVVDLSKMLRLNQGGWCLISYRGGNRCRRNKRRRRRYGGLVQCSMEEIQTHMMRMHRCTLTSTNPQRQLLHLVREKNDDVVGKFTRNIWSHGKNHPIPKHPFCELYVKKRQKSILHCELVENWGKTPLPNNIGMVTLCETHYINRSSKAQLRLQRHSPYQIVLYSFEEEQIIEIQHGNLKIPWKFPESCTHNLKWDPVGFL